MRFRLIRLYLLKIWWCLTWSEKQVYILHGMEVKSQEFVDLCKRVGNLDIKEF